MNTTLFTISASISNVDSVAAILSSLLLLLLKCFMLSWLCLSGFRFSGAAMV